MTTSQFDVRVRRLDGLAVLDLEGEVNASAEAALSVGYDQAEREHTGGILLNFTDVSYINSTGIALIVSLLGRARAGGRRLLACGLTEHYVEIFNITRLADFMSVVPDESTALTEGAVARPAT